MRSRSLLILMAATMKPQIGRHGLLQSQQADGEVVDLDLDLIDAAFVPQYFVGERFVLLNNGRDASIDGRFDQANSSRAASLSAVPVLPQNGAIWFLL